MDKYYIIKELAGMQVKKVELTEEELIEIKDCIYTSREVGNQHDTQIDVLEKIGKVLE